VEDDASHRCPDSLPALFVDSDLDWAAKVGVAHFVSHLRFVEVVEERQLLGILAGIPLLFREVIAAQNNIKRRCHYRLSAGRVKEVLTGKHYLACFRNRRTRQGHMNSHLVAIEVGVESGADERMDLDSASVDEDGFECLDTQAVEGRSAVEQNRTLLDY